MLVVQRQHNRSIDSWNSSSNVSHNSWQGLAWHGRDAIWGASPQVRRCYLVTHELPGCDDTGSCAGQEPGSIAEGSFLRKTNIELNGWRTAIFQLHMSSPCSREVWCSIHPSVWSWKRTVCGRFKLQRGDLTITSSNSKNCFIMQHGLSVRSLRPL